MKSMTSRILLCFVLFSALICVGCGEPFDPPAVIKTFRFLGIKADPLESAPGEEITFSALVVNSDGSIYEGPVAWAVVGSDALRLEGEVTFNPEDAFLQPDPETPFVWTVPTEDAEGFRLGELDENGILLTIGAAAFPDGNMEKEPIIAYKTFVVSHRAVENRRINPELENFSVRTGGSALRPGDDGVYRTTANKVNIKAHTDPLPNDLTFHWFAGEDEFEPDFGAKQDFEPDGEGAYEVYCVIRKKHYFQQTNNSQTLFSGIDWRSVKITFE